MKREEILTKKNSEKEIVNVKSVIRKDVASVNSLLSDLELSLIKHEDAIESHLKNENLTIDSQFLETYTEKESVLNRIETLKKIKEEYL
jgi:hypothetical protein